MSKENQLINEIRNIPVISPSSAISPFIQVCSFETNEPLRNVHTLNVQTGEAQVYETADGILKMTPEGKAILRTVFIDRKKYYIAFK